MANTIRRFNPLLVFLAIALTWCCVGNIHLTVCAARGTPVLQSSSSSDVNMKKPDCLDDAGRVLIPGVGSSYVTLPPDDDQTSQSSSSSSTTTSGGPLPTGGGSDSAGTADTDPAAGDLETGPGYSPPEYIPGNDDTFFPNPGYEVPIGVHANTNSVKAP